MIGASSISLGSLRMRSQKQPPEVVYKKSVLRNFAKFTGKHLCQSLFFNKVEGSACNAVKKESLVRGFSCEFCKISKNTFSHRTLPVAVFWFANLQKSSAELMIIWPDFTWQNTTFLIVPLNPSMALYHDGLHYNAYRSGNRDGRWKSA